MSRVLKKAALLPTITVLVVLAEWTGLPSATKSAGASAGASQTNRTLVFIVNKSSPLDNLSFQDLRKIFLGERSKWPDGHKVTLVMQEQGREEREVFLRLVCRMNENDYNRYILQAAFTGTVQSGPRLLSSASGVVASSQTSRLAPALRPRPQRLGPGWGPYAEGREEPVEASRPYQDSIITVAMSSTFFPGSCPRTRFTPLGRHVPSGPQICRTPDENVTLETLAPLDGKRGECPFAFQVLKAASICVSCTLGGRKSLPEIDPSNFPQTSPLLRATARLCANYATRKPR